jgi:hypothetical protein
MIEKGTTINNFTNWKEIKGFLDKNLRLYNSK